MNVTQSQGWLQWIWENKAEAAASSLIVIALAAIMFGAAGAAISHNTFPQHDPYQTDEWYRARDAMMTASNKTLPLAIIGLEGGAFVLTFGIAWKVYLYQNKKTERAGVENLTPEDAQKEVRAKRLKAVGFLLGFLVAMLGVGLITSTSIALHEISNVKSLMNEIPHYHTEMQEWINSCEPTVNGLLATGVLVSIVGGGIFGGTLFFAELRAAWNKHFRQISAESAVSQKKGDDDL